MDPIYHSTAVQSRDLHIFLQTKATVEISPQMCTNLSTSRSSVLGTCITLRISYKFYRENLTVLDRCSFCLCGLSRLCIISRFPLIVVPDVDCFIHIAIIIPWERILVGISGDPVLRGYHRASCGPSTCAHLLHLGPSTPVSLRWSPGRSTVHRALSC